MRRLLLAMTALGGCGRLQFDPTDAAPTPNAGDAGDATDSSSFMCTPVGHDEDNDGVDDACDVCAATVDPGQADMDGDRVGDLCDPEPAVGRQQLILFESFATLDAARWTWSNDERVENDELVLDAAGTSRNIQLPYTRGQDWFTISATAGTPGGGDYLISMVTAPLTPPGGFYCQLFDDGVTVTSFTWTTDNVVYNHPSITTWPASRLANGGGLFEYTLTDTDARCRSAWRGDVQSAEAPFPTSIPVEHFTIYAENIPVRVQWFAQVRTNP